MNCEIIFYMSHKTGYVQRTLKKSLELCRRECGELQIVGSGAAVSPADFCEKLTVSLERVDVVFVIGGLSFDKEYDVMELLSDYFPDNDMDVTFNKRVENSEGGRDGYIIRSGEKYVAVLPDEPEQVRAMVGVELLSCIDFPRNECREQYNDADDEQGEIVHTVVFAPQPDDTLDKLKPKKRSDLLLKVSIAVGIAAVVCAASWLVYVFAVSV